MKKGDTILVYGTVVDWRSQPAGNFKAEYWFLRGLKAKILTVVNDEELTVRFLNDSKKSMRPLYGIITEVHPKQCRKVRK